MVVPDPPLSGKQDKDVVVQIASTLAPTSSQGFSQLKGCYSSLTSQGDSPACPYQGFSDIVTNTSHLSNLAIFAKNKTERVWKNKYKIISKVRAGSQSSSYSCPPKYVRNKNLNFDVKYGIACAIPELYADDAYSGQNYSNSDYIYSESFYDTPVTHSHHDISTGVNSSLSSSKYKTSKFPLISVGKGLDLQVEGEREQSSQSVYNAQDLQESSSVTSDSSKNRWKNKNSKVRKEAFSTLRTDSVKHFFCLYGKIVHTDDCKCLKINLWKRCLLPVCYPSKVCNSDTTVFGNVYQNDLDEGVYDVHVSSLSEEVTTDTTIGVSAPKSAPKRIHYKQSCTTYLEPICESAEETDKHLNEFGLEADLGIGEEITQYNTGTADLRVFSTETANTVLSSVYHTHNFSSREESQTHNYSSREESQTCNYSSREESQTSNYSSREESQTHKYSSREESQTRNYSLREESQTSNYSSREESQTHNYSSREESQTHNYTSRDIDNRLEQQVPYTGESSIDEKFGLDPWVAISLQSTRKMASQGKKNKNEFVRKAAPPSPMNKIGEGGSSGYSTPDVTNMQMGLVEVGIDSAALSTGQQDRNVTNKIELTQGSPPEFALEQHGIPSNAGVGDASHKLRQKYDLGSPSSVNVQYSDESSSVATVHSHPFSSPNTGNNSQIAYPDSTGSSGTPPRYKTQTPVPPAKPPRTFKSEIVDQHSASSMHKEAQLGSAQILGDTFRNAQQQQFSRLQKQGSQLFANNFDDDDQWYIRQSHASYHPLTASKEDIQFEYLEEQARVQYEGPEILFNNGQKGNSNQSTLLQTQVGQNLPLYMNEQEQGEFSSMHFSNKTHYSSVEHKPSGQHEGMISRVPNAGKMGQTSSGHQDSWMDEMKSGQNSGQMAQQQSGFHGDGQQQGLKQMPGMKHGKSMQPVHKGLQDGILGQMHPHAQMNTMQLNEKGFQENVQGVQSQQGYMAQDGHSSDTYSHDEGTTYHTGKSSYMTDRELAHEQLDQKMNNPWFREMVQNMKELVEREGLVVKDVFPDGNCLFTAVVDQIRVHGNFKYTPSTLRAAAVNYLKENSKQRDGTPLEHFLFNETWENYLVRMSRDGEWGEHIILGAISEVLRCRINVLGGMSGKSCTVVQPQHMSDKEEEEREKKRMETKDVKTASDNQTANNTVSEGQAVDKTISDNKATDMAKSDKSTSHDETNSETSQDKAGSKSASYQTGEQSKLLQTSAASLPKQTDAKTESTDTSQTKDQTDVCSKQNWDKENEELSQGEELFIGLLGEMHYVSLRKKDWEERLHEKLWARIKRREEQRNGRSADGSASNDDMCLPEDELDLVRKDDFSVDHTSGIPLLHLNYLCQELLPLVARSAIVSTFEQLASFSDMECLLYSFEVFGKEEFMLDLLPVSQRNTHFADLLNVSNKENANMRMKSKVVFEFSMKDTVIHESGQDYGEIDLILIRSGCSFPFVRLRPTNPSVWGKFSKDDITDVALLRHVEIDTNPLAKEEVRRKEPPFISFPCQWPQEAMEYVRRSRTNGWPNQVIFENILFKGCRVVPDKTRNDDTLWVFTFHAAEKILLSQGISRHQKDCYRLWKLYLRSHFKDEILQNPLFRSIFFYACEELHSEMWEKKPATCILYLTERLAVGLRRMFIPDYFVAQFNMVDRIPHRNISYWLEKLITMRHNLLKHAYLLIDQFETYYPNLMITYDRVIADLNKFSEDGNMGRSFNDLILPFISDKVNQLVDNRCYTEAENLILWLYEVTSRFNLHLNFNSFFQQVVTKLSISLRWCFAFFIDKRQGTFLIKEVCNNQKTVSIAAIFGHEIVQIIGKLHVPEIYVGGKQCVYFANHATELFFRLGLDKAVTVSLFFFLRKIYLPEKGIFAFDEGDQHKPTDIFSDKEAKAMNIDQTLYQMFMRLYDLLLDKGSVMKFRDLMPQFELTCNRYNKLHVYEFLYKLWTWYGSVEKARQAAAKYHSLEQDENYADDID